MPCDYKLLHAFRKEEGFTQLICIQNLSECADVRLADGDGADLGMKLSAKRRALS